MEKITLEERIENLEQAIINLAQHVERCPMCEYHVANETLEMLGYEPLPTRTKPTQSNNIERI